MTECMSFMLYGVPEYKIVWSSAAQMYNTDTSQNGVQELGNELTSRHMSSNMHGRLPCMLLDRLNMLCAMTYDCLQWWVKYFGPKQLQVFLKKMMGIIFV